MKAIKLQKWYLIGVLLPLFFLVLLSCEQSTKTVEQKKTPYVVMLSMDGCRWDYPDKIQTRGFKYMEEKGVRARLQSSFPSKTFPNHYSIATGLYPDHHGLVNNTFWDPKTQSVYAIKDRSKVEEGQYYLGEPIWNTVQNNGIEAATFFWVGSEAPVQGQQAHIWKKYQHHLPFKQRADSVIKWLQLPESQRPHLIMWYVSEPDGVGHHHGPNSNEILNEMQSLDSLLFYFIQEMEHLPNADEINFIVTADHGMQQLNDERAVILEDILPDKWAKRILGSNPVYNIWAEEGYKDSIYQILKEVHGISIYDKNTIPQQWHYMQNERCGDFLVLADSAFSVQKNRSISSNKGAHGYDNFNSNMDAIFYAYGPLFNQDTSMHFFQNVDIYNLITHMFDIQGAENDGDDDALPLLKDYK